MSVKLLQGDCLELMKGIPDESVDMILTDPPYGIDLITSLLYWRQKVNIKLSRITLAIF